MNYEDGNVLAGPLSDVFAVDITAAMTICAGCGRHDHVAGLRVYGGEPGLVARCAGCDAVVLRYAHTPRGRWLDLRGAVSLHWVPIAPDGAEGVE
jgi:Family of unknown function (DUF6510)